MVKVGTLSSGVVGQCIPRDCATACLCIRRVVASRLGQCNVLTRVILAAGCAWTVWAKNSVVGVGKGWTLEDVEAQSALCLPCEQYTDRLLACTCISVCTLSRFVLVVAPYMHNYLFRPLGMMIK